MQEPLNSLVTRNPSPPALPLGLFPQQPPRNGPQALPRIGPGFPQSCRSLLRTGLGLLSALRLLWASSPDNSPVSVVLMKTSSSRAVT